MSTDAASGKIMLGGASEGHLDEAIDILRRTYGVDADIGAPQVAYRERLTRRVEQDHTHSVRIVFEPNEPGEGNAFEAKAESGAVPTDYVSGVERGVDSGFGSGVVAGVPLIDVKATLIDGAFDDADSSVLAFEIASRAAFREALRGGSVLLEPIMKVEAAAPEDHAESVSSDRGLSIIQRVVRRRVPGRTVMSDQSDLSGIVLWVAVVGQLDQSLRSQAPIPFYREIPPKPGDFKASNLLSTLKLS